MATFDIFIDTNAGKAVLGLANVQAATLPPLVQGDTLNLRIWLLQQTAAFPNGKAPYSLIPTAGISLTLAIGDKIGNTSNIYAQQLTWTPSGSSDPLQQYWTAQLALNTAAITTLLGAGSTATAWLEVKYTAGGYPSTVLALQVTINAAVYKTGALVVPPGGTAMTAEEANAVFLKRLVSGAITLQNPNTGAKVAIYVADDGTFHADPIS